MAAGGVTKNLATLGAAAWVLLACAAAMAGEVFVYGGGFDLAIPGQAGETKGWMADASIDICDHHLIKDLDVRLSIAHTSIFDLQIFLQSPTGTTVFLNYYDIADGYFKAADYTQTVFDDEAATGIEEGSAPFTGSFRPKAGSSLSMFDDTDCFGMWKLRVYDAYYGDAGTLHSFELMITNPEPATAALLAAGFLIISRKKR